MPETLVFYLLSGLLIVTSALVIGQRNPMYSVLLLVGIVRRTRRTIHSARRAVRRRGSDHHLRRRCDGAVPLRRHASERAPGRCGRVGSNASFAAAGIRAVRRPAGAAARRPTRLGAGDRGGYRGPVGARAGSEAVSSVRALGRALFTDYVFAFEATSILILVAMVGAVVLARREDQQSIPLGHYLIVSAILFAIGTAGVFLRRNLITILLSIEIMLNAVNLSFVAFGRQLGSFDGQIITFFVIAVAAAEAAVGLAIIIALYRHRESLNPDAFTSLRW